ncbi:MAG TPA: hypothetical protein VHC49_15650 [Mycobacteriales bacterium]|nr:hypothetical protein [Mycobacteriales bacterium]
MRKRWYVLIPGLAVTLVAAVLAMRIVPPSLQATGSVLLISPSVETGNDGGPATPTNPYLNFGAPLGATAEVVSAAVNSDRTAKELKQDGATGTYQVALDPNSSAPLLSVQATADDNARAMATLQAVITAIHDQLQQIQADAGAPINQYIKTEVVTSSQNATPVHGSLLRVLAVIMILGVLGSCGAVVLVEGISRGRARRSAGAGDPPAPREKEDEQPDEKSVTEDGELAMHSPRAVGADW